MASLILLGSCHLILFVSSGNYFQIVRRQCCLKEGGEIFTWICHITQWALTRVLPCWLWRCHVWIAVTDGGQLKISDQISGLFVQLGLHPVLLLLADHPHHDRWSSSPSKIQCNNKQVEHGNHKNHCNKQPTRHSNHKNHCNKQPTRSPPRHSNQSNEQVTETLQRRHLGAGSSVSSSE